MGTPPTLDFSAVASGPAATGPSLVLDKGDPRNGLVFQTPNYPGVSAPRKQATVVDVDTGAAHWYSLTDGERESFGERAFKAGLIQNPSDYSQVQAAWNAAVQQAAGFYTYGQKQVTPWEAIDIMAGLQPGGGANKPFSGQKTTVDRNVEIPSATTIRAGLKSVFTQELGRAPTADEIDRYSSMFVKAAKDNPVVTRTTGTFENGQQVASNSTKSGGVDLGQLATEKTQATDEYGAYQASTTYMNALMQAIGGTG